MIKVVLDTNILISATFWKGNPYKVFNLVLERKIQGNITLEILEEYSKVLKRDFQLGEEEIQKRTERILESFTTVHQ
ncbi:MAG: putative toxin-antitoxin system toxin component, PIN family [Candidatus Diapherotrites archaeon]|nr:putative toxin-antitoxin system toxin component, PIN family [Candidatus Diapherotrites archaeon]